MPEFDARINVLIEAETEEEALQILQRLVVLDPETGQEFNADTEDGVEEI